MPFSFGNILQALSGSPTAIAQTRAQMGASSGPLTRIDPNDFIGQGERPAPQAVSQEAPMPANIMQSLDQTPPQMAKMEAEAPRKRLSLIDTIGRVADVFANVGGAQAQYQPYLDAREDRALGMEDRSRQIDLDGLRKRLTEQQIAAGDMGVQDDERSRLGQALGAVSADPKGGAAMWPQIAEQAGLSPERTAQIGGILAKNPQAASIFAASLGYTAPKPPSQAKELQVYSLLQSKDPKLAEVYLRGISNPQSITPYQQAQLKIASDKFGFDMYKYENPQPTAAERNASAGVGGKRGGGGAGGGADDVNAILTDFNIKLNGKDDPVADLIRTSTSGYVESVASLIPGALGKATPGRENIGQLETIDNALVLALAGGKLGAGVSNADRDFFKEMSGKISDPTIPANQRLAGWEQIKSRLRGIQRRANQKPAAQPAARPAAKPRYQPSPNRKPVPAAGGNPAALAEARRRGLIK
jgi:hypothetical protein